MRSAARVLVTGGAGFIGSHLCQALASSGACVSIVDNLNDFYSPAAKQQNLLEVRKAGDVFVHVCDICDPQALRRAFASARPDVVIHLAAYAGVRPSILRPKLYEEVNIGGTLNVLELCREFKVPKLIFGSSSSVYGAKDKVPFAEDDVRLRTISPYAATKLSGEILAYTYAYLFGLSVVCLRFFTVYGPRQRPDLVIHKFTGLIEAGLPVPLYGDGKAGRDYTYVADIVAGVVAAVGFAPPTAGAGRFDVFNLGNCHPVSVLELIGHLEAVLGKKAAIDVQAPQAGDVPITCADISKAAHWLQYRPAVPLQEGLAEFVRWYRAAGPAYRSHRKAAAKAANAAA